MLEWVKGLGTNILESIAILMVGIVLIKLARRVSRALFARTKIDGTVSSFITSLLQALIVLVIFFMIMTALHIDTTSFVTIFTAGGLAIGLALQDSISNLSSGIIILATKPFKEDDHVSIGGTEGKVKKIRISLTEILTFDNVLVTIPNSVVVKSEIRNLSDKPTRRLDIFVSASLMDEPAEVKTILKKLVSADKRVLKEPKPTIVVSEIASGAVTYRARVWVLSGDYWGVYNDFLENSLVTLKKSGITIPFNSITLYEGSTQLNKPQPPAKSNAVRLKDSGSIGKLKDSDSIGKLKDSGSIGKLKDSDSIGKLKDSDSKETRSDE